MVPFEIRQGDPSLGLRDRLHGSGLHRGREVFRAITTKESALVVSIVVVLVLVYLLMNLLIDLLYAALDPRIRYE